MALAFLFRVHRHFCGGAIASLDDRKFFGGGYLVYIAVRHLFFETNNAKKAKSCSTSTAILSLLDPTGEELTETKTEQEIRGRVPVYVKPETSQRIGLASFWPTVGSIGLTDIAFAVDSILAAIALVGPPPRPPHFIPSSGSSFVGGLLGMIVLRFAAGLVIRLLEQFPRFEIAAYLVGPRHRPQAAGRLGV